MGTARRLPGLWLRLFLGCAACTPAAHAADFELTPAESARVNAGEIVIRASLDPGQRKGTARAAILIGATPDIVFQLMSRCADAVRYVPHLRLCRVRDRAADDSWQLVEHEIDFGWYAPRLKWVFRADFVPDRSIAFSQVTGDFKANYGLWEFEPVDDGKRTLLRYRAYIDPPGYVPNWLARSTFKRELPQMLTDLRQHCEAEQAARTAAAH
ncbi:MAG TPA: SRPBCC family protein [Steroidobacteraceae bacterium]|nr:SRPBCC family protein [Steroidobacteraceae bacterium]